MTIRDGTPGMIREIERTGAVHLRFLPDPVNRNTCGKAGFSDASSFILWGGLLAVALRRGWSVLIAFAGAGLLHLALDFPLHTHDARMHFWPLSTWVFESTLSY